ncbi:MAG: hypothetical protein Rubg2KO_19880 [Rubricoccaceae bacterium]
MASVRPTVDDAVWADLASRRWRRTRWRNGLAEDARCAAYGTPIHRRGTYYRRPAYTDGSLWLSQQAYDDLRRWMDARANRQSTPDR